MSETRSSILQSLAEDEYQDSFKEESCPTCAEKDEQIKEHVKSELERVEALTMLYEKRNNECAELQKKLDEVDESLRHACDRLDEKDKRIAELEEDNQILFTSNGKKTTEINQLKADIQKVIESVVDMSLDIPLSMRGTLHYEHLTKAINLLEQTMENK